MLPSVSVEGGGAGESGAHAEGRGAQNRPRVDNRVVGVEAKTFAFAISPAIIELPGSLSADGLNQRPLLQHSTVILTLNSKIVSKIEILG